MGTSLQATLQLAALSSTVYIMIVAAILRSRILDKLKNYQEIHNKSELPCVLYLCSSTCLNKSRTIILNIGGRQVTVPIKQNS